MNATHNDDQLSKIADFYRQRRTELAKNQTSVQSSKFWDMFSDSEKQEIRQDTRNIHSRIESVIDFVPAGLKR